MSVEQPEQTPWMQVGETISCTVDESAFDVDFEGSITLRLRVDEVLEAFGRRRVLVASAQEVDGEEPEGLEDVARKALLHPTYLIEETTRLTDEPRPWDEDLGELVRTPVQVEQLDGVRRSVFVDNRGIAVGDLVDLVRGELQFQQVELIFRAVVELFESLHGRGWAHLGLTPWNLRVFDPSGSDSFLQAFVAQAFEKTEAPAGKDIAAAAKKGDRSSVDKAPEFGDRGKTVVELKPLGDAPDSSDLEQIGDGDEIDEEDWELVEGSDRDTIDEEFSAEAALLFESEFSWSEIDGETSAADDALGEVDLRAVLDGLDRLYPIGRINDEIAVTPGFSAPELLSGLGTNDGVTADVFSLGMFLYFLVSGVVPPASVYTRYAPAIPARNFRPAFPPGLQTVISRATRPRPEDRFASVRSMMDAFDEACDVIRRRAGIHHIANPPVVRQASDTHIGISKRRSNPTNQDSVFSATSDDGRFSLIVVADGVSTASYGSGDLASTALTEEAAKVWEDVLPTYLMEQTLDEVEVIAEILNRANHRIVEYVNDRFSPFRGSPHEVMGSTALVALIVDGTVTLASLGDSRVYLQRGVAMEQMTIDHNLWTLSILEGVEADAALSMPHGDALARCLGTFVVESGTLNKVNPNPDLFRFQVMEGDTILLTTDGLVDFAGTNLLASEDNILSVLLAEPDPALACLELILLANRGGGGDNVGLSVVKVL